MTYNFQKCFKLLKIYTFYSKRYNAFIFEFGIDFD